MTRTPDADDPRRVPVSQWPTADRAWYPARWLAIACTVLFALVTADVLADGLLRHFDGVLAGWIRTVGLRDSAVGSAIGYVLSQTGGRATNLVWILVLCIVIAVKSRNFVPFVRLALGVALLSAAIYTSKFLIARTFPTDPRGDLLHAVGYNDSYPSGHQANAILLSSIGAWIAVDYIATVWVRRVVCIYAIAGPIIAAFAVLFMNYHWLSDIIAGASVGIVLLWIARRASVTKMGRRVEDWFETGLAATVAKWLGRSPVDEH
ncbi:PAP2 superfamily protein [Antricoccus suffuscus]|uniref:PAP2 superfamily protein n=1 Tax=Antricoccus suffuscus TaxID=1629062 RepID=A0A2T1A4V2_9ACTN|nr:phosphatase PAP2 family protein [Antricoccus suffuscus]PRZ43632.1 PAP2 superfamily protein [Antricoccus suffuscus]